MPESYLALIVLKALAVADHHLASTPDADADPRLVPRRRELTRSHYHGQPTHTYKHDRRSCVWRMNRPAIAVEEEESERTAKLAPQWGGNDASEHVVKRFEYSPLRQRLALCLHLHPGQRELAANHALRRAGVPVVPIVDTGFEAAPPMGLGCRFWLVTPALNESLQQKLHRSRAGDEGGPELWLASVAELTRLLLDAGFAFRDLKPSNIVFDDQGQPYLLDVGSVRATRCPRAAARMLATMRRVLARDGVSEPTIRRYLESVTAPKR